MRELKNIKITGFEVSGISGCEPGKILREAMILSLRENVIVDVEINKNIHRINPIIMINSVRKIDE